MKQLRHFVRCVMPICATIGCAYAGGTDSLKEKLHGGWSWISSSGGIGGSIFTPLNQQYTMTMVFDKKIPQLKSDSIGYKVYKNDSCIVSEIAPIAIDTYFAKWVVGIKQIDHIWRFMIFELTDTLIVSDGCFDGYSSTFVRQTVPVQLRPTVQPARLNSVAAAGSSGCFTMLGRKLNPRPDKRRAFSTQIVVSRSKAEVAVFRK